MQILFLSNFYPPAHVGGMELRCMEVVEALIKRGHACVVLTSDWPVDHGEIAPQPDVLRTLSLEADIFHYRWFDYLLHYPSRLRNNMRAVEKTIAAFQPDLVFVWGMWNFSPALVTVAERIMPGRVVFSFANYWPIDPDLHEQYWQGHDAGWKGRIFRRLLAPIALSRRYRPIGIDQVKFDDAIACSKYVLEALRAQGVHISKGRVIYSGIDPEPFLGDKTESTNTKLRLLYVGSLVPHKGVHTAIEAMEVLKQRGMLDQVNLTIVGSGHPRYEAHLKTLAINHGIQNQVNFVPSVPRSEIPVWLSRHDVFLFTSIWPEPLARSVMEAMAAGLLVIGTEVGGQVEMLQHGENALTFDSGDAKSLAQHIISVIGEPRQLAQLAKAGQRMVLEQFTLERMVNEVEMWLESIVASP